jgi:sacsin
MKIAHLRVLVNIAHVHPNHLAILPDIIATYKFLEEKADDSPQLSLLRDEPLFLNVDQTAEDWEWESAANLSFDVRDVGHFKSVRRFLHKYKSLLIAAGAQEVNHPRIASAVDADHDLGHGRMRRKFNEMRRRRKLVDVEFVPRDYDADRPLLGHRSFLAAASDHLMDMFCSDFIEGRAASTDDPVQVYMADYSRDSVSLILGKTYFECSSTLILNLANPRLHIWHPVRVSFGLDSSGGNQVGGVLEDAGSGWSYQTSYH